MDPELIDLISYKLFLATKYFIVDFHNGYATGSEVRHCRQEIENAAKEALRHQSTSRERVR